MILKIYNVLRNLLNPSGSLLLRYFGLQNYKSVLDIGCGKGSVLEVFNNKYKMGIDAFDDYINISRDKKIHHDYILGNITEMNLEKILPNFDAVIIFDLIEHLNEKEAKELVNKIEEFPNIKFIAIKTPSTYIEQDSYDGNDFQIHKSFINYKYFKNKGYTVIGCDGPKFLYVNNNRIIETSSFGRGILSYILRPIFTFIPAKSLNYLAILKR